MGSILVIFISSIIRKKAINHKSIWQCACVTMTGCFDCHKLMAVDRSSRKSLHSIELSRNIPSKPHKFVEGILLFVFFLSGFVCWFVYILCSAFVFCLFNSLGDGILFSAEHSTYINLLSLSIGPDIVVYQEYFLHFINFLFVLFCFVWFLFPFYFVLCVLLRIFWFVYLYFIVFLFVFVCFCFVFVFVCFLFIFLFILICIVLLSYSTLH